MKRTPHTTYPKGAHVYLILTDGRHIDDIYEEHRSGCVVLREAGRVLLKDIRSMSYRKLK